MIGEQLEIGQALRDEGTALVEANSPDGWRQKVDAAIRSLATLGGPFTADTLRALPDVGEPHHPNAWGARFQAAARSGVIRRVGCQPSGRASVHGHPVAVWQGMAE